VSVVLALGGVAAGCDQPPTRSTERFCGELQAHVEQIQTPPEKPEAIPNLITLFSKMGEVAPLEVQKDWEQVYGVLKTANTVNPSDPNSVQVAADAAYRADSAARSIVDWASANCGITLGPVAFVPGGAEGETTTTIVVDTSIAETTTTPG
jgi:hypothetical protein